MNPDLDLNNWLESVWSPDFFENNIIIIMMATKNCKKIESSDKSPALVSLSGSYKH